MKFLCERSHSCGFVARIPPTYSSLQDTPSGDSRHRVLPGVPICPADARSFRRIAPEDSSRGIIGDSKSMVVRRIAPEDFSRGIIGDSRSMVFRRIAQYEFFEGGNG